MPKHEEVQKWFEELSSFPSYSEALSNYQKEKIFVYSKDKLLSEFRFAVDCMNVRPPENYPEGIKKEERLKYIIHNQLWGRFESIIKVLNNIEWHWTFEKGFERLKVKNQNSEENMEYPDAPFPEINSKWKFLVNDGEKLNQRHIALVCVYEGIHIPKPGKSYDLADKIAKFHGHNSGANLYNKHYLIVRNQTDRRTSKTPKNAKKDIEKALAFLSTGKAINEALRDIHYLNTKIEQEEK